MSKSSHERLAALDIAKMICIILVVIGHYDPAPAPEHYNNLLLAIYTFHMPVFLFISGYLYIITRKEDSFKTFIVKKIKRLTIPYFVTSAIVITIKLLTQGVVSVNHPVTAMSYLRMFYLPEAGYFMWFVIALFVMFVLVFFFKSREARLLLFAVSFIATFLPSCGIDVMCLWQTQEMMVYFMTGVIVADYAPDLYKIGIFPTVVILVVFIALEAYYVLCQGSVIIYQLLAFLGIAAIMPLCHNCEKRVPVLARACVVLAPSVYIIYLFHTTVLGFAKSAFGHFAVFNNNSDEAFYLLAICAIVCGILVPILLYHYIKRYKILKLLFGV